MNVDGVDIVMYRVAPYCHEGLLKQALHLDVAGYGRPQQQALPVRAVASPTWAAKVIPQMSDLPVPRHEL